MRHCPTCDCQTTMRRDPPLVVTSPVSITHVSTTQGMGMGFRRIELPEPVNLKAGAYRVDVADDDTVTFTRL